MCFVCFEVACEGAIAIGAAFAKTEIRKMVNCIYATHNLNSEIVFVVDK